jgi:hypothetical protein
MNSPVCQEVKWSEVAQNGRNFSFRWVVENEKSAKLNVLTDFFATACYCADQNCQVNCAFL